MYSPSFHSGNHFATQFSLKRYPSSTVDQVTYLQELHHYRIHCDYLSSYISKLADKAQYTAKSDECEETCDHILPSCMLTKQPVSNNPNIPSNPPGFLPVSDTSLLKMTRQAGQDPIPITNSPPISAHRFGSLSYIRSTCGVRVMYWVFHLFFILLLLVIDSNVYLTQLGFSLQVGIPILLVVAFYWYWMTMATSPGEVLPPHPRFGHDSRQDHSLLSRIDECSAEWQMSVSAPFTEHGNDGDGLAHHTASTTPTQIRTETPTQEYSYRSENESLSSIDISHHTITVSQSKDHNQSNSPQPEHSRDDPDDLVQYHYNYTYLQTEPFIYPSVDQIRSNIRQYYSVERGSQRRSTTYGDNESSQKYINVHDLTRYGMIDINHLSSLLSTSSSALQRPLDAAEPTSVSVVNPIHAMSPSTLYLLSLLILHPQYCPICGVVRPPLTKHCYREGVCYARFDHTCGFLGTTIAGNNHRYFVYLLFAEWFVLLSGIWLLVLSMPHSFTFGTTIRQMACYLVHQCTSLTVDFVEPTTTPNASSSTILHSLMSYIIPFPPFSIGVNAATMLPNNYHAASMKWYSYFTLLLFLVVMIIFVTLLFLMHIYLMCSGETTASVLSPSLHSSSSSSPSDHSATTQRIASGQVYFTQPISPMISLLSKEQPRPSQQTTTTMPHFAHFHTKYGLYFSPRSKASNTSSMGNEERPRDLVYWTSVFHLETFFQTALFQSTSQSYSPRFTSIHGPTSAMQDSIAIPHLLWLQWKALVMMVVNTPKQLWSVVSTYVTSCSTRENTHDYERVPTDEQMTADDH